MRGKLIASKIRGDLRFGLPKADKSEVNRLLSITLSQKGKVKKLDDGYYELVN